VVAPLATSRKPPEIEAVPPLPNATSPPSTASAFKAADSLFYEYKCQCSQRAARYRQYRWPEGRSERYAEIAAELVRYCFTTEDKGLVLRRYRTNACQSCAIKHGCTTSKERLISRWEHEAVLETVQARLDQHPEKMTIRRQTAEHPFGTIKYWMGATHFLTKRLPKVATEMALNVLAYNMKRVMAIIGVARLLEALAA
jgi:Transposase DDE domain